MKKTISKAVIRDTCLQKQQELIDNFSSRVNEMTTDANSQNQSASQSEDRNAGDIEILSTLATPALVRVPTNQFFLPHNVLS